MACICQSSPAHARVFAAARQPLPVPYKGKSWHLTISVLLPHLLTGHGRKLSGVEAKDVLDLLAMALGDGI